ncbi:MerR family transcriptional regulator [Nocardiopsis trehalosi]|uniref:MerR family transcriptional regulator n=1 Tax=Nocardiopsis trehalosi TaxID=109329 RepID=UPI000835EA9E|nr:MerR family transcriptional regulator [Nocardiopsis trehalosi]
MSDEELYSIGDAAMRSGLSVSAVRFYSDAGVVPATDVTEAGHRLYDVHAIARLELVRTLRDLDTGLDGIRRLLDGGTNLHDLLTTHLGVLERQAHVLRGRQAVLRALLKQSGTPAQAVLMHKLVTMSDEERERLIDDFWSEVGADLDVPAGFVDRLRTMRPRLPEDPSAAQLGAWIELADLVRDPDFRDAVRAYLRDTYSTHPGRVIASGPVQDFIYTTGASAGEELFAAYNDGEPADSPRSRAAAARFAEATAAFAGEEPTPLFLDRLATGFAYGDELAREEGPDAFADPRYDGTHGRYLSLVAVINGTPPDDGEVPFAWIAAALRASASGTEPASDR